MDPSNLRMCAMKQRIVGETSSWRNGALCVIFVPLTLWCRSLRWQRLGEAHAARQPCLKVGLVGKAIRLRVDKAAQGAPGEIHGPGMRLGKRGAVLLRSRTRQ